LDAEKQPQWSEVINPDFASHVVRRIPNCRYTDGAWRPHFDEYDVYQDPQYSMNVSTEGIHEREKVLYRKVETFFWGGVVGIC